MKWLTQWQATSIQETLNSKRNMSKQRNISKNRHKTEIDRKCFFLKFVFLSVVQISTLIVAVSVSFMA